MYEPTTDFVVDVTEEQIAFFREQGFLRIDRITTDEEIEWLRGVYDELFEKRVGEAEGAYFDLGGRRAHSGREVLPQILGPERTVPALRETIYFRNARRIASKLLGVDEEKLSAGGHMILKPARYGLETPWHQDEAYWSARMLHHGLSAWLPLDPATVESGCLQFIPGSHRSETILEHRHIDDDPLVHGLVTDHVDPSQAVPCPLEPGGATFNHCRTLHYAGPNRTDRVRRAYIIVVNAPGKPQNVPERPWIVAEHEALKQLKSLARE